MYFYQLYWIFLDSLAERGGFEPPVQLLTVQRFSKPPPSATRPSLRNAGCTDYSGSISVSYIRPRILRKFFSLRSQPLLFRIGNPAPCPSYCWPDSHTASQTRPASARFTPLKALHRASALPGCSAIPDWQTRPPLDDVAAGSYNKIGRASF